MAGSTWEQPYLVDRADGVRGHFCVGRTVHGSDIVYHEFWHEVRGWCSAGTVYFGVKAANAKVRELRLQASKHSPG